MEDDYIIGEVVMMAGRAARGLVRCDGALLAVKDFRLLFLVIGDTFGGDGKTTFGLPDLSGRVALGMDHADSRFALGATGGAREVSLDVDHMPPHAHDLQAAILTPANPAQLTATPASDRCLTASVPAFYVPGPAFVRMADAIGDTGSGQPHDNCQPALAIDYYIATSGAWPS